VAQGSDWAHWTRGFHNVIRARTFRDSQRQGVRLVTQGEVPEGVVGQLVERVPNATGWDVAKPS
jgi:hypothetical protein